MSASSLVFNLRDHEPEKLRYYTAAALAVPDTINTPICLHTPFITDRQVSTMLLALPFIATLVSLSVADSKNERITPPRGVLIVDASGKLQGSYLNVSAAVTALQQTVSTQTIYIAPGIYVEQVYVPLLAGPLVMQGYTKDARSYKDNKVTISGNLSRLSPNLTNNDATATLRLHTSNVKLYNLNIINTFGEGAQALALSAQRTDQGFYGCRFEGFQDTIYANEGRQIYAKSFINGTCTPYTDYSTHEDSKRRQAL